MLCSKDEYEQSEWTKGRVLRNLAVVSAGVFLYLSSNLPSTELQSSLNFQDGLGTESSAIGTAINIIPSVLIPPYVIRRFGLKACMVGAISLGSVAYFGNYYPSPWTLIPAAILTNMGTSPMWAAKGTYITHIAEKYSKLTGEDVGPITNNFFGIFYSTYYSGYIFGNLLPYYILQRKESSVGDLSLCGFNFCDATSSVNNTNFDRPSNDKVYTLFGIFAAISFCGALVILIFLDSLVVPNAYSDSWRRALDSIIIFKRWHQSCMTMISFYRGLNRALLTADFTKGYITCTWGMNHVGYIMISFGVGCGVFSLLLGFIVRWVGRPILFSTAIASNLGIMLAMIFWRPNQDEYLVFFALVVIWGASNAVWESQVAALNPILYPDLRNAAYNNYANSEWVGNAVGYGISAAVCMHIKIYLNLAVLGAAAISYIALELGPLRKAAKDKVKQELGSENTITPTMDMKPNNLIMEKVLKDTEDGHKNKKNIDIKDDSTRM